VSEPLSIHSGWRSSVAGDVAVRGEGREALEGVLGRVLQLGILPAHGGAAAQVVREAHVHLRLEAEHFRVARVDVEGGRLLQGQAAHRVGLEQLAEHDLLPVVVEDRHVQRHAAIPGRALDAELVGGELLGVERARDEAVLRRAGGRGHRHVGELQAARLLVVGVVAAEGHGDGLVGAVLVLEFADLLRLLAEAQLRARRQRVGNIEVGAGKQRPALGVVPRDDPAERVDAGVRREGCVEDRRAGREVRRGRVEGRQGRAVTGGGTGSGCVAIGPSG
jgi:hypothetical protein